MAEGSSFDYGSLVASGAIGGSSGHASSFGGVDGVGGGDMKLFPLEGVNIDGAITTPALNPLPTHSPDEMFASINKGGGALGQTVHSLGEEVAGYLGTPSAKGDNVAIQLGHGELSNMKTPTTPSEAGVKKVGLFGSDGQQHG